jgi:hypothetical protein
MPKVFMITVLYRHNDGRNVEACAIIGAPDALEAIDAAAEAVKALPHCAEVLGGMCEEMGGEAPNAQRATHATHATVN